MSDPIWEPYDSSRARALISQIQTATTFQSIASWDNAAEQEVALIGKHLEGYEAALGRTQARIVELANEVAKKAFLARMFRSRKEEAEQRRWLRALPRYRDEASVQREALQYWIDFTPNDASAKKEMLKELKAKKKELGLRKKEVGAEIRAVNQAAREANAEISSSWLSTPSGRRYSRMQVRMKKQSSLRPHETEKAAIERQILEIERLIIWMERLN